MRDRGADKLLGGRPAGSSIRDQGGLPRDVDSHTRVVEAPRAHWSLPTWSAAYDLEEGKIDVVFQANNKIWDIHPLMPIIKASGGIVTTWNNRNAVNAGNILVSANQSIHNKMLKLLKPISK